MRTNSLLTPCKQGAVFSRYSIELGNENELLTHLSVQTPHIFDLSSYHFKQLFKSTW